MLDPQMPRILTPAEATIREAERRYLQDAAFHARVRGAVDTAFPYESQQTMGTDMWVAVLKAAAVALVIFGKED